MTNELTLHGVMAGLSNVALHDQSVSSTAGRGRLLKNRDQGCALLLLRRSQFRVTPIDFFDDLLMWPYRRRES
jgi:hypothetical protein